MLRTGAERTQRGDAVRERNACTRERERVICDVMGMTSVIDERAPGSLFDDYCNAIQCRTSARKNSSGS